MASSVFVTLKVNHGKWWASEYAIVYACFVCMCVFCTHCMVLKQDPYKHGEQIIELCTEPLRLLNPVVYSCGN